MRKVRLSLGLLLVWSIGYLSAAPHYGNDSVSSDWIQEWYHYNDWMHYLDNHNTFVTIEQETTGEYNHTAQQIFSIAGNSYKWNKYYLNGFRTDSRFSVGSTFYNPDLYQESLTVNYYNSGIHFSTDSVVTNSISVSGNVGGLGGISPGTKELINLFHSSASERLYMPIGNRRNKILGAGSISLTYNIPSADGQTYRQRLQAEYGQRKIVSFDQTGIDAYTPYNFSRVQLDGQLPIKPNSAFKRIDYIANYLYRDDYGSEFYLNRNELSTQQGGGLSVYGTQKTDISQYIIGLTWQTNSVKHHALDFRRNLIDQDGESFEPWSPDGFTTELNLSTTYERQLLSWLRLKYEGYNSAIYFKPTTAEWSNDVYWQLATDTLGIVQPAYDLYHLEWQSRPFWSGILENTIGLDAEYDIARWISLRADLDITLDGIMLGNKKSLIRPNWQAGIGFDIHPCSWFRMELNMQKQRVSFNYDDVRFLSSDYMNGNIYYADGQTLFSTTGGAYHNAKNGLKQTSYFVFDIPVYFTFRDGGNGKHELQFMQSYRKYWNCWYVDKWQDGQYGYMTTDIVHINNMDLPLPVWYTNDGIKQYTITDTFAKGIFGNNILTDSPYYLSSVIRYSYSSKKVHFSIGWQSYQMCGVSALGNGAQSNNLNILSESYANPNTWTSARNPESPHQATGRLDQDKAYVCWIQFTYNPIKELGFSINGKFKDGQPVTSYTIKPFTNSSGNTQMAILPTRTRGINMFDKDFGSREDAFFNIDLRVIYSPTIRNHRCEFSATCYNIYDFGTSLHEYNFVNGTKELRNVLSICIPRGILVQARVEL